MEWKRSRSIKEAKAAGRAFDAVLVDLTVPGGMGGKEVADQLRQIDRSVTSIASSGYSDAPVMSEFRRYGFDDVIPKPWTPNQLSEVLQRCQRRQENRGNP
jgi:two-component system cell cycle sensor histidine kinase/response regulator CckA